MSNKRQLKNGKMSTKFKVVNVVAVQHAGFPIDVNKLHNDSALLYDTEETQSNRYMAIKPPGATHQITFFACGNMITVGNKSVAEAKRNLLIGRKYLSKFQSKVPYVYAWNPKSKE